MDPIISFEHFSFKYRTQTEPTLTDINLKIYPGEKVLIAGPSGSGKSTLAHCINALIPCSVSGDITGSLKVAGMVPAEAGIFGMSKIVGTVLQDTNGQFIGLTVAEDIAFALENEATDQSEMKKKVGEAAELVEMTPFLEQSPFELSGGQKQRVSMAGVLVEDVKLLLFDEPLANLDPATGKRSMALIDEIARKKNVTVLIIEHRLEDVLYRDIDRIILINDGRILADMKPDEMLCTDLLRREGIREPLYIAALKYAGCRIDPKDGPQHIETMNTDPYREAVRRFYQKETKKPGRNEAASCLTVKDLTFSYAGGREVLSDISFSVRKGEMFGIVGRNGAGKSTLISLICGFFKPQKGEILLNGEDISSLSIKERGERIGFVMQSPSQMISCPMIREEVGLGLTVRNTPEQEVNERVEEVLKICGLYPFRNWPVNALSFGQKKRVTIASILVMKPEIIILDEPTAGQDYRHYTEIMQFLKKLNEDLGLTIIMITHDMHLMLEYTDRAVVLSEGRLLTDDSPANILTSESIAEKAYLKKTSLYDLAVKCGITDPGAFTQHFIQYERMQSDA